MNSINNNNNQNSNDSSFEIIYTNLGKGNKEEFYRTKKYTIYNDCIKQPTQMQVFSKFYNLLIEIAFIEKCGQKYVFNQQKLADGFSISNDLLSRKLGCSTSMIEKCFSMGREFGFFTSSLKRKIERKEYKSERKIFLDASLAVEYLSVVDEKAFIEKFDHNRRTIKKMLGLRIFFIKNLLQNSLLFAKKKKEEFWEWLNHHIRGLQKKYLIKVYEYTNQWKRSGDSHFEFYKTMLLKCIKKSKITHQESEIFKKWIKQNISIGDIVNALKENDFNFYKTNSNFILS